MTWLAAGLLVAAAEMVAPGFFLLWVGLAMLGTGAAAELAGLSWHEQLGLFVLLAVLLVGVAAVRLRHRPGFDLVNAPSAGLVGRACEALEFRDGHGRVRLGDGAWPARTTDGSAPLPGASLQVSGLEGTTLLVRGMPPPPS